MSHLNEVFLGCFIDELIVQLQDEVGSPDSPALITSCKDES